MEDGHVVFLPADEEVRWVDLTDIENCVDGHLDWLA